MVCLGAVDVRSAQTDLHAQPEEISMTLQMPHPVLIKMVIAESILSTVCEESVYEYCFLIVTYNFGFIPRHL